MKRGIQALLFFSLATGTVIAQLLLVHKDRWNNFFREEGAIMLSWALTFLIIALIAGILGLVGVAGAATNIAWILFLVFLILFVLSFVTGRRVPPI